MLNAIVSFSLRYRGIVVTLALLAAAYGVLTVARAKYDVFPEFAPPQVAVQTEAPGLSPEQVELLVTQPIENALNGVEGIESLRSNSIQGLSIVTLTFVPGSDIHVGRQSVTERLATLTGQLPQGIHPPAMTPMTSSTSVVQGIGLTSESRSLMDLRTVADWTLRPRLLAVPGVSKVSVFGGEVRQLQIQVRPEMLVKFNLGFDDILAAARRSTGVRGAGVIDNENQRIAIQTSGQAVSPEEIGATVLTHQGNVSVTLDQVANVTVAPEPPIGAAAVGGQPAVILMVAAQFAANTLTVTENVEQALTDLRPSLEAEGIKLHTDIFRPANFIQTAVNNVRTSLLLGGVLVVLVLFLFLMNLRTAAISCVAIPLSLLGAATVLEGFGLSLNTMTLGGLAIAIGEVVDDAIIDVENILRRLRENQTRPAPLAPLRVILDASLEVRSAVVYATFAVVLVFIPLLTLSGIAGRLFAPLGVAYIAAVSVSLLVALTVTPALCLMFLRASSVSSTEPPLMRSVKKRYTDLLRGIERRSGLVIGGVAVLTVIGLFLASLLGGAFLPELREGHFIVHVSAVPGTSLAESLRLGRRVSEALLKLPYVGAVAQRAGRAEQADDVFGTHYSEFNVDLRPLEGEEGEFAMGEIRKVLAGFPGVNAAVKTFLTERVEETLTGYTAAVVVNIVGNDLDSLDRDAPEIARTLADIPGATEIQVQSPPGTPQLAVRLRSEDLARWGLSPVDVLETIRLAFQGETVSQVFEGNRVVDVSVILDPAERRTVEQVGTLPLRNADGTYVALRQVADVYETSGRYVVLHQGARRVQTVTCNVSGRDVSSFVAEAQRRIRSENRLPSGTYIEFSGAAEAQTRSGRELIIHSLLAGAGVVLLLSIVFGHARNLLLVLANLPFALVGGILAVFVSGGWLTLGSMVGFVTLFGITLRNSIMMISHYDHLVSIEGMSWGAETAIRGAAERLTPIMMTALVTALGLLPLAIGSRAPGREIEGPLAIVILGGLATSTLLNLLVLPTLALRFGRFSVSKERQPSGHGC